MSKKDSQPTNPIKATSETENDVALFLNPATETCDEPLIPGAERFMLKESSDAPTFSTKKMNRNNRSVQKCTAPIAQRGES